MANRPVWAEGAGAPVSSSVAQYKCAQRRRRDSAAYATGGMAQIWARQAPADNLIGGMRWLFMWEAALVAAEAGAPASAEFLSLPADTWPRAWAMALREAEVREALEALVHMRIDKGFVVRDMVDPEDRRKMTATKIPRSTAASVYTVHVNGKPVLQMNEHPTDVVYTSFVASLLRQRA